MSLNHEQVHALLDQMTLAELGAWPLVFKNQDDSINSEGTAPYIKQLVLWTTSSQRELGAPSRARNRGSLLLILHERRGQGSASSNAMLKTVLSSFRSKQVSGVTLMNARIVSQGETLNWNLTSVEIPFYWDEV